MFADVIIRNNAKFSDTLFTYEVDEEIADKIKVGQILAVSFGISSKPIEAVVVALYDDYKNTIDISKIKTVNSIIEEEPIISEEYINLLFWMRDRYMCTYADCLSLFYPKGYHFEAKKVVKLNKKILLQNEIENVGLNTDKFLNFVSFIKEYDYMVDYSLLKKSFSERFIRELGKNKYISICWESKKSKNEKILYFYSLSKTYDEILAYCKENKVRLGSKQNDVLKFLSLNGEVEKSDLKDICSASTSTITSLIDKGLINVSESTFYRNVEPNLLVNSEKVMLNDDQKNIIDIFDNNRHKSFNKPILLHGVTGSGKTEVYLELIQKMLDEGKDSIFLVPEIALTPQMISRVKNRFGSLVGAYNSSLSEGEKHDLFREVRDGNIKVLVGTRSALFMPFKNLGLIVVDEEHDSSYQSDKNPKYNTIDICRYLNFKFNVSIVLGSATPSVSDYYTAKKGDFLLTTLNNRANDKPLPSIEVVDMREENNRGNFSELSERLIEEIRTTLESGDQVMLFLNRRGYASFLSCKNCGHVERCDNCDITLTYHKYGNRCTCHYCGYEKNLDNKICPSCNVGMLDTIGIGTEKIQEYIQNMFPTYSVLRIDKDTTSKKGDLERILNDFNSGKAQILIGTQMLSKGHNFKNVTLVGIISADMMLNFPDYRAFETSFQIITQVAGRSGRGEKEGKVILQTYDTEHYAINTAIDYDYVGFYDREIDIRQKFRYEPFNNIFRIILTATSNDKARHNAQKCFQTFKYLMEEMGAYDEKHLLGPSQCSINKINNKYRWHIIIKDSNLGLKQIKAMIKYVCVTKHYEIFDDGVFVSIEQNPKTYI